MPEGNAPMPPLRLQMVTVPVADVDRAIEFYASIGFAVEQDIHVDKDHRFVELIPPGSDCSIAVTQGYLDSPPGTLKNVQFNVDDVAAVHGALRARNVSVTDIQDYQWGRFCFFSDPDGNSFAVHEPT